jgi:hypothetical protein
MTNRKRKEQTITGIVVPERWDGNGKVVSVDLRTAGYR